MLVPTTMYSGIMLLLRPALPTWMLGCDGHLHEDPVSIGRARLLFGILETMRLLLVHSWSLSGYGTEQLQARR